MKNNRRNFLKLSGFAGLGLAGARMIESCTTTKQSQSATQATDQILAQVQRSHSQHFNMSGYAAPPIDTVRIGVIGLGNRGAETVRLLSTIDGIDIKAVCDLVPSAVDAAKTILAPKGFHPDGYSGSEEAWKQICDRNDIDLVYIITPWAWHTPMAVYGMEHNKHVAVEVPAALTIDDCWRLVETCERTRKHCIMLENSNFDFIELLNLNLVRQGFFGEIIHGEGAYIHDRFHRLFEKDKTTWRLKENINKNGNLYPTHGFGPICQVMNINHGEKLDFLVSTSSDDFMLGKMADKLAETDDFWKPYAHQKFRGNMNISTLRTSAGRTIMLQHDTTSPRVYSNIHLISGTKAMAQKFPLPARMSTGEEWMTAEEFKKIEEQHTPPITKRMGEIAKEVGGHGGMDLLLNWRLIDCLRNGLALDMDVYDAATYSCVVPLSQWSVANRSHSIEVPDFTCGSWKTNKPVMDITFERGGGTTKVKA